MTARVNKAVLAYSGGIHASVAISLLKEKYGCQVVAVACNLGQDDPIQAVRDNAIRLGASKCYVEDLRREFILDYLWPLVKSGAMENDAHRLGAALARSLVAKRQVEVALAEDADAVAHGCPGDADDSGQFELSYKTLAPHLKVIAPLREWNIASRREAGAYAAENRIPVASSDAGANSRESNIWQIRYCGGTLDDLSQPPPEELFMLTLDPRSCPEGESEITIDFEEGVPIGLNGYRIPPVQLVEDLNEIAGTNGIGRADCVENRGFGTKFRAVYEAPGGALITAAHRELESIVLDPETQRQKEVIALTYAQLADGGRWFTPLREALDAFFDKTQQVVTGAVTMRLFKGAMVVKSRSSPFSITRSAAPVIHPYETLARTV